MYQGRCTKKAFISSRDDKKKVNIENEIASAKKRVTIEAHTF